MVIQVVTTYELGYIIHLMLQTTGCITLLYRFGQHKVVVKQDGVDIQPTNFVRSFPLEITLEDAFPSEMHQIELNLLPAWPLFQLI